MPGNWQRTPEKTERVNQETVTLGDLGPLQLRMGLNRKSSDQSTE